MRVLILGGTSEARALAARLAEQPGIDVTSSLAGRVRDPALPVGDVRVGGFGGADGLAAYLRAERVEVVVDATHPFAATISAHAAAAAAATDRPLVIVRRRGWTESPADDWRRVPDTRTGAQAAAALPAGCIFVTTGRRDLAAYAADDGHHYLVRTVDPPETATPAHMTLLLDRGPYAVDGELALMRQHHVIALVTKDSGGEMTVAKLVAARCHEIPVIMVDRPPAPAGVPVVETVDAATAWVAAVRPTGSAAG